MVCISHEICKAKNVYHIDIVIAPDNGHKNDPECLLFLRVCSPNYYYKFGTVK